MNSYAPKDSWAGQPYIKEGGEGNQEKRLFQRGSIFGNLETRTLRNFETRKPRNLYIWKLLNLKTWNIGNL